MTCKKKNKPKLFEFRLKIECKKQPVIKKVLIDLILEILETWQNCSTQV